MFHVHLLPGGLERDQCCLGPGVPPPAHHRQDVRMPALVREAPPRWLRCGPGCAPLTACMVAQSPPLPPLLTSAPPFASALPALAGAKSFPWAATPRLFRARISMNCKWLLCGRFAGACLGLSFSSRPMFLDRKGVRDFFHPHFLLMNVPTLLP